MQIFFGRVLLCKLCVAIPSPFHFNIFYFHFFFRLPENGIVCAMLLLLLSVGIQWRDLCEGIVRCHRVRFLRRYATDERKTCIHNNPWYLCAVGQQVVHSHTLHNKKYVPVVGMRTTERFRFRMLVFFIAPASLSTRSSWHHEDCDPRLLLIHTHRVLHSSTFHSIENTSQLTCTYSIIIIIVGCYVLTGQRWYSWNIIHKSQATDLWNRIIICDMPNSHYYHILFIRFYANVCATYHFTRLWSAHSIICPHPDRH